MGTPSPSDLLQASHERELEPALILDRDRVPDLFTQVVSELRPSAHSLRLIPASFGLARSDFEEQFGGLEACFLEAIDRALQRYGPLIESLLELLDADRPLAAVLAHDLVERCGHVPRHRSRARRW